MKSSATRLRRIDSVKFESMYSERDAIRYSECRIGNMSFEEIEPFLYKLPPREIDLVTLYRKYGKNQKDIAKMFSVTQGAISSRLRRAADRLQFLRDLPKITEKEIDQFCGPSYDKNGKILKEGLFDPISIEIIKFMIETTCQSKTAELINERHNFDEKDKMTQVKVRHRFEKCLARLKEKKSPEYQKYYNLLFYIKNNLYKLHEVSLPHFSRPSAAVFSLST
jgi:Sigma-70, region 4